jgi:ATP phosphoribosyltransferase regulatory subunit
VLGDIDEAAARALVEEMMAVAGIARAGARTASEIARRFVAKASGGHAGLDAAALRTLSAYLAIAGPARAALDQVAGLAREAGLDLDSALEGLNGRFELLSVGGIDLDAARFATEFGRRIEYYTGLVFEIRDPAGPAAGQIAGGGRYDRFLADLGAESRIAAVGCSIYVDRLAVALGRGG